MLKTTFEINELLGRNQTMEELVKVEGLRWWSEEEMEKFTRLLLEARDALPAITLTNARLHNISLTLADRIEEALKPWLVEN